MYTNHVAVGKIFSQLRKMKSLEEKRDFLANALMEMRLGPEDAFYMFYFETADIPENHMKYGRLQRYERLAALADYLDGEHTNEEKEAKICEEASRGTFTRADADELIAQYLKD